MGSVFLHHTGCDWCGSSDALAHYSDGSKFCFSCRRSTNGTGASFNAKTAWQDEDDDELVVLPPDLSHDFPIEVFKFIEPTGLRIEELIKHGYFFSKTTGQLVRVFPEEYSEGVPRTIRGRARGFENRNVYPTARGPKTSFRGSKESTIVVHHLLQQASRGSNVEEGGEEEADSRLVVVEDSLSAIKVGRWAPAEPLFGSSISLSKLAKLVKPFKHIFVWLDSDKLDYARKIAEQVGLLGKQSTVIYTELDPKYVSDQEIKKLLQLS